MRIILWLWFRSISASRSTSPVRARVWRVAGRPSSARARSALPPTCFAALCKKNGGPASADAIAGVLHAGGARAQWARSDYGATYETSSPLRALFFTRHCSAMTAYEGAVTLGLCQVLPWLLGVLGSLAELS